MTIIPASRYVFDDDGKINSTVQIAMSHIVQSMNQLSSVGAALKDPISSQVVPSTGPWSIFSALEYGVFFSPFEHKECCHMHGIHFV